MHFFRDLIRARELELEYVMRGRYLANDKKKNK